MIEEGEDVCVVVGGGNGEIKDGVSSLVSYLFLTQWTVYEP